MKSIADSDLIRVFTDFHEHLLVRGINTSYMRLYNEAYTYFQREPKANNIYFQLSPPVIHFHNAEEHAISTFKNHFIARLCSTDPDLPMQNWDSLLEQADIIIKFLRPSRLNTKLS